MTQTIEIIVSPNGETQVQTKGFVGASCREASKFIEDALGTHAGERVTPEFFQTHSVEQQARQRS